MLFGRCLKCGISSILHVNNLNAQEYFMKKVLVLFVLAFVASCSNVSAPSQPSFTDPLPEVSGLLRMVISPAVSADTTEYYGEGFDFNCIAPMSAYFSDTVKIIYAKWRKFGVTIIDSTVPADGKKWVPGK